LMTWWFGQNRTRTPLFTEPSIPIRSTKPEISSCWAALPKAHVIRDDEMRLDLWMKRRGPTRQREYRRLFRFDDTAAGTKAHNTYEFCSEYGVHGHVSDAMHLERVGTFLPPNRDEFAVLTVSDSGVLSALQVWLAAFGSLHQLCLETFVPKHGEILSEPSRLFIQMIEAIGPILKAISTRLHQLAASRPN
jgi:hypothetical protein